MSSGTETLQPAFNPEWHFDAALGFYGSGPPLISSGKPYDEVIANHIDKILGASRAYVLASKTLATQTKAFTRLQRALGSRLVGHRIGMKPHTYMSEVLEIVNDARNAEADVLITLGGGSLADAAKAVAFALANNVSSSDELKRLPHIMDRDRPATPSKIPIIAIPTTLSAGEFTPYAGVTDDVDHVKYQFVPPLKSPAIVILDGEVAVTTPLKIWLSTGVRSVDHCVEALASPTPPTGRVGPADEASIEGLRCLIAGLIKTNKSPQNGSTRHICQLGMPCGIAHLLLGVMVGASHGIGHMLGPLGVGHGETSCILMPAVNKWNAAHGADPERQKLIRSVLWDIDAAKEIFESQGLSSSESDLGDLLDVFLRELGMPRSLAEFGIGEEQFEMIAKNSMRDPFLLTNPVPITTPEAVMEILRMCK